MINKLYYKVGDIAKDMNVSPHLVRYYIDMIGVKHHKRNNRNYRLFLQSQYNDLIIYISLVKSGRFTLNGAALYLKELRDFIS